MMMIVSTESIDSYAWDGNILYEYEFVFRPLHVFATNPQFDWEIWYSMRSKSIERAYAQ